jgi:flagellar hook assembly protein FlgD
VWDGKDASGQTLAKGTYSMTVDKGTSTSDITASWSGRVDAVELTASGPRLRIGGVLLAPGDIHTIGNESAPSGQKA